MMMGHELLDRVFSMQIAQVANRFGVVPRAGRRSAEGG